MWTRLYVEAAKGLGRWPSIRRPTEEGLAIALAMAVGLRDSDDASAAVVTKLESFAIEDDSTPEWQHIVDLTSILLDVLRGEPLQDSIEHALTWFLDGRIIVLSAVVGARNSSEASTLVGRDPRWQRTLSWVEAL